MNIVFKGNIKDNLIKLTDLTCVLFICSIVFIAGLEIFLRYIFNISLTWSNELICFLFIWYVFIGAILVTEKNSHLKMDFLVDKLPYNIKITIDFIFSLLIIWFLVMLLKGSIGLILQTYTNKSPAMRIPMVIVFSCVQINALFIIIIYFFRIIQFLKNIFHKK